MKRALKLSVCNSSAKTFAMQMTKIDVVLSLVLMGAACGAAWVWGCEASVVRRALLALLAAVGAYSTFVIVRVLVPFLMRFSFAHMMRLRSSFYLWVFSLVVTAGMCGATKLFSTVSSASVQMTLVLASVMLVIRFFQSGSLLRLALAFSCAGGAVGLSALGVLAPAATLSLMWFMPGNLLVASPIACWQDKPHPCVVEYFSNPLLRSRAKWLFLGSYLVCSALAFYSVFRGAGGFSNARHAWLCCIGFDDVMFLLTTAVLPLVIGLGKVGTTSNVFERSDFGGLAVYMAIAPITALLMLRPDLVLSLAEHDMRLGGSAQMLATVIYVFNMLLSSMVILADIRCRDFRGEDGVHLDSLRNVMLFIYAIISIAPLFLLGYAVFLLLR